ncbi:putative repeat protein (TIGR01451 family) [Paenibacillus sp. BK033]|uniref:DUF7507 domain-containing protein n=1 Tax=Paenibacillus sp. BK033 TaxID=2512133 RepID=UPI00104B250C|nr:SBBP repeat-containing protein [Paenibacillus sp. BK033]TCN01339.1 putative repeat protein (TIGR01451 family) [Paenibacillus sp. BK033]
MIPIETKRKAVMSHWNAPRTFVRNEGQTRGDICYYSNKSGSQIAFSSDQVLFVFTGNMQEQQVGMALSLRFLNANKDVLLDGLHQTSEKVHYLVGNDPRKWHTGLSAYKEIMYRELWPGIDLVFYEDKGNFKYDVAVKPGARISDIRFEYQGSEGLMLSEEGNLHIRTSLGLLTEERPVCHQIIDGQKVQVAGRFLLQEDAAIYGFEVGEEYRPDYELIIDPALAYSTYLGGSDTDIGSSIAVDGQDNAYVTGQTLSLDFPVTPGAFQPFKDGSSSVFVTKINPEGSALIYSTFLGGSSSDQGRGIAVDASGQAYVTGQTLSPDFPTTPGVFQPFLSGGQDAFVTKLSPDGGSLVYSSYLGGEGVDTGFGIALDGIGNAYIAGGTSSSNFPNTSVVQSFIANEHAFVTKINTTGSAIEYSALLSGHGLDEAHSVAVDGAGSAYVTGSTTSVDFPTTPGAFQISLTGVIAAFVSKLNNNGSLLYSTYLTGGGDDEGNGIAVDDFGQAYVTGSTTSHDFPITPNSFQPFYGGGSSDAFVTKLSPDGNYLVYSTFLGGSESDAGNGIAVRSGFAYVTGSTGSFNFPITPDAFQPFQADGGDAFLTQLNIMGNELVFSTYLGGNASDVGNAVAVDNSDCIFLTGQTSSFNFPVSPGAYQPFLRGGSDAFVLRFCLSLGTIVKKFPDRFEVARGEQVVYTIDIQNPSAATLTNVVVHDPFLGLFEVIPVIPPFSNHIVQFVYNVPLDQPLGPITNTVFVTSDQFSEPPLTAESEVLVTGTPLLVASKKVNPPAAFPGDTVIFTLIVENHGDSDLLNVHIVDPLLGLDQFIGDIPPGGIYDIDWPFVIPPEAQAGLSIANFMTITSDNLPQPEEVGTVVEVLPVPRLEMIKEADRNIVFPGESVRFFITVINSGNVELTNIRIFDDITGSEFFIPVLFTGESRTIDFVFDIPLEMPPQIYINTASAISDQTGEPVFDSAEVNVLADARLGIIKFPETSSVAPGQTILYTVVLENIGNVPLTGIRIIDPLLGIDEFVPDLAVGEIRHHVFSFIVPREASIGTDIVNLLTVETSETGPQEAESVISVTGVGLSLLKEPDRAIALPGDLITYTLTVTNLLNTPQTNVVLSDSLLGISETVPVLQPNETITLTLTFAVPVDALEGSVIRNTLIVESDQSPQQETNADVVVVLPPGPALLIQKLPDRNTVHPGETITYTLTVTNLFNIAQTNVILVDELLGLNERIALLPANDTVTFTLTFTVPVDAAIGSIIRNTFRVFSDQSAEQETAAEVIVEAFPGPLLLVLKAADRNTAAPGETIAYTVSVTNLLNVPQNNVRLIDPFLGVDETIPVLPPNGTVTLTFTFTVPLSAVPGTILRNTVVAASDQSPETETVAEVIVENPPGPALFIRKVADRNTASPGETITYTLTVTNLLGTPQTNVVLTDVLLGLSETIPLLIANGSVSLTLTFTVPLDAVLGSTIRNTFTAASDQSPEAETVAEVTVQEPPGQTLQIQKVADRNTAVPGDTITYTLTVTNLLNVPQTNVVLTDALLGLSETIPTLPANGSITLTLPLTVPLDAVVGSVVRNTFIVSSDQSPELETIAEVQVESSPGPETTLIVRKRSDRSSALPGDTIRYTIEVTNTGVIPATNVVVNDSLTGQSFTIPVIAPGGTERVSFEFAVPPGTTQGTVIANRVTVTWTEKPPGSLPVVDEQRVIVADPVELPELEVEATPELPKPGETVTKTITVTNVTNNTLTNVRVFDTLLRFQTTIPSLAPGERRVFTLQLPIAPGTRGGTRFRNIVTIFSDQTPQQQKEVDIEVQSIPDASLTESVDPSIGKPGETVVFTIKFCNTGNVSLFNVKLNAPLLGIEVRIVEFEAGACETIRIPFVLPEVEEDTVLVSPATLVSDNGPTRQASASVTIIVEEE